MDLSSLYKTVNSVTDDLVKGAGRKMILRTEASGTYDVDTGQVSRTVSDSVFYGVLTKYVTDQRDKTVAQDGGAVIICRLDTPPKVSSKVIIDQEVWTVGAVQIVKPGCPTMLCKLMVHK